MLSFPGTGSSSRFGNFVHWVVKSNNAFSRLIVHLIVEHNLSAFSLRLLPAKPQTATGYTKLRGNVGIDRIQLEKGSFFIHPLH